MALQVVLKVVAGEQNFPIEDPEVQQLQWLDKLEDGRPEVGERLCELAFHCSVHYARAEGGL